MTEARVRRMGLLLGAAALALAACASQRTPAPVPRHTPSMVETLTRGGTPALQPYLDTYPLGTLGTRADLLAETPKRSMHLVQTRTPIPRHLHPARTETVYVVTGRGTCYVGDASYPVAPGSAFRIAPGVPHSALPADGSTIVAIVYYEPPMTGADDRVLVE